MQRKDGDGQKRPGCLQTNSTIASDEKSQSTNATEQMAQSMGERPRLAIDARSRSEWEAGKIVPTSKNRTDVS